MWGEKLFNVIILGPIRLILETPGVVSTPMLGPSVFDHCNKYWKLDLSKTV